MHLSGQQTHQFSQTQARGAAIRRRPVMLPAIALMLGIFEHDSVSIAPIAWTIALIVLVLVALLLSRKSLVSSLLLLAACGIGGIARAQIEAYFYPAHHISAFATDDPRLVQLQLLLDYPPRTLTWPYGQYRATPPKQVVTATVQRIKTWNGWVDCTGQVLVQIQQPNPRLAQGQLVQVLGTLERPGPAMNPGQFDWAGYYREQRILASVRVAQAGNIRIISSPSSDGLLGAPISWLREQSRRLLARGFTSDHMLDHALLRALVLGDSDPELRDVQEQFRRTGTSHHLAISGMHVAVLGGVVFGICRLFRMTPRKASWLALILVMVYGAVALPSPPVVRSILLCVAFALGILTRNSLDHLQLLALTIIAMLVYHPLDLYNAGFQLSFGTVLGMIIFTPFVLGLIQKRDLDEQIAMAMQRPTKFSILRMKARHLFDTTIAAGLVAWLVSMPLIALHFEQLNPWAILASILLAPLVLASLIGGFAKIALTLLWPSGAGTWASVAVIPVSGMRWMVDWLAKFPAADVPFPSPPIWLILTYYALLLSLLIPWRRAWMSWTLRPLALVGCAALAITPFYRGFASFQAHASDLKITLLSIGAGQVAVVEPPGAPAVIIDAGSSAMMDMVNKAIGPFLRHEGRREVNSIFISHPNYDHFSAVAELTSAYDVSQIYVSPHFRRQSVDNAPAEGMLHALDQLDRPPREISTGRTIDLGAGATLEIIWPTPDASFDANNNCLVLRLNFAGRSILFPGDIQGPAERVLMQSPAAIRSDVLVAPHHGSAEVTTGAFIEAVAPGFIVCSNDRTLSMKQREFDQLTQGRTVYRTHTSGAITIRISPDGQISVERYLQDHHTN